MIIYSSNPLLDYIILFDYNVIRIYNSVCIDTQKRIVTTMKSVNGEIQYVNINYFKAYISVEDLPDEDFIKLIPHTIDLC